MMDAAVVWIAEGVTSPATPSEDAKRSLDAWARARGVKLVAPSEEPAPSVSVDWAAGDAVERELVRAREALMGLEFDAAERALARADATLRDHPELPQAAWLRAEVERAWSLRWLRSNDEARAKQAWQRAASLDGGRAPGLGEKAFEGPATITATVRLEADGDAALRLDGAPVATGEVTRAEGEHAAAAVRADGTIAWADWVSLAQGTIVRVAVPFAPSCSRSDVGRARFQRDAVVTSSVHCEHWVVALDEGEGVIRVAACERDACGPLVEWRVAQVPAWTFVPGAAEAGASRTSTDSHAHWPAWATWTLAGVGVAGAAIAVIVATGALKSAPTETHFVNGGLQIHSF